MAHVPESGVAPESGAASTSEDALVLLARDSWRFARTFGRLLVRLDAVEQKRLISQYDFFLKQLEDALALAGFKLVNLEGMPFDPGMAATPINLADFAPDEQLFIEQMLEPVIMTAGGSIKKMGTVVLKKAPTP
jgi:hypothetical protein